MPRGHGEIQQKVLLLLLGGLSLGLSGSPRTSLRILSAISKDWKEIERRALKRAIESLYKSKMVGMKYDKERDAVTIVLTNKGKKKALTYDLDRMELKKPNRWDKKWRIVLFDIPEINRRERDVLRDRLKNLGFYEFQKSVFAHPYDCKEEIEYIIEFYNLRKFVRFIVADSLDNELHLKEYFCLL